MDTPDPMVKLADVIAVIDDNQYALERVPVGWNLLVKIRAGINAIPVAPTPSPDIAGLVDRLRLWAQWETRRKAPRPQTARPDDLYKAATALQSVAQERDAANREATRLLVSFVHEHCDPVPDWAPLPDLMGVLTQISNAVTVTRDIQAKLAAAEARIASARDEGLEMAAKACERQSEVFGSTDYATGQPLSSFAERFACERCAEDIRALKGQPK